jgi:GAF domain-containing protein
MLREGEAVGAISVARREPGRFSDAEMELLRTFADQAVIAVENVRLFNETKEALEQQTATAEVLQVISRSPSDVQPVFDTIACSAVRLCDASFGAVFQMQGDLLDLVAHDGIGDDEIDGFRSVWPMRPNADSIIGRALLTGGVVQVEDAASDPNYRYASVQRAVGYRTIAAVPMRRESQAIGVIATWRLEARPFSPKQIDLLKTFAAQAVIAIENVRLFKDLEARTTELTRSVDQLTALGEVGRAVSSTLDLQTVLNTIVARAVDMSASHGGLIYEYDATQQEFYVIRGAHHLDDELAQLIRGAPIRLGEGVAGKAAALRVPVQVPDILDEGAYDVARIRTIFQRRGYRSLLAIPLLLEQQIIGVLVVWRQEPGRFVPEVVNLLQTFGTQSALAIQNARLFLEIADKSRQLEAASRH